ncbi:MAG: hypothetical protein LBG62_01865 [Candidatus Methanoplasma sp.]|jgi:hypothetical protein|nr:hypothetical protein [Candidatus Methanoplasma sp.]
MTRGWLSTDRSGGAGAAACIAIVIVLIVVLGAVKLDLASKKLDRVQEVHGTLEINVRSTHILADTEVTIYVDGEKIGKWRLENLAKIQKRHDCSWIKALGDSRTVTVKAVSTGGHLGPVTAAKTVKVQGTAPPA